MAEMSVLVAYASKHGSTELIADVIGDALRRAGHDVDVRPVSDVRDLTRYGAAVVGSALYIGRWQGDALTFLRRHEASLAGMPVWFFSSGPLDDSAETAQLPAPKAVAEIPAPAPQARARDRRAHRPSWPRDLRRAPRARCARVRRALHDPRWQDRRLAQLRAHRDVGRCRRRGAGPSAAGPIMVAGEVKPRPVATAAQESSSRAFCTNRRPEAIRQPATV